MRIFSDLDSHPKSKGGREEGRKGGRKGGREKGRKGGWEKGRKGRREEEYKFIQNHFHPTRDNLIQNHFDPKPVSSQNHFHPKPLSSQNHFHPMSKNQFHLQQQGPLDHPKCPEEGETINRVRVCVKVSPAEGWRRLHTNTVYAHGRLRVQRWGFWCLGFRV